MLKHMIGSWQDFEQTFTRTTQDGEAALARKPPAQRRADGPRLSVRKPSV
jgi:hypothetical protein